MFTTYLKIFIGTVVVFGVLAFLFTAGFVFLIGGLLVLGVMLLWYRFKFALAGKSAKGPVHAMHTHTRKESDGKVIEVDYVVIEPGKEEKEKTHENEPL